MTPWYVSVVFDLLIVGMAMSLEVVFTAFYDLRKAKNWKLKGYTYVWMVPIYALIYPLACVVFPRFAPLPWAVRGLIYTAMIYAVEYTSGWLLRRATGHCPWEDGYYESPWGVHGLVRFDFVPAWFSASLVYEFVFRVLSGLY